MARADSDLFDRLEQFYDALPRPWARIEEIGSLVLFVREGEGWPYYARPRLGAPAPTTGDLLDVRRRQRDLGVPETLEWVHETTPDLLAVARSAGLDALLAPLLRLDPQALVPDLPVPGGAIRTLDPAGAGFAADLSASRAVAQLAFAAPAYRSALESAEKTLLIEGAGPSERDATAGLGLSDEVIRHTRLTLDSGDYETVVVEADGEGIVATGTSMRVGEVAEIAGVATLPTARGRGYASQLTATLARRLLERGVRLIFLSAGDDDVARLYTRVGFRRIGTACVAEPAALPL
ncbi:GNAT family N-acetyltransferase [Actinoplanes awajinensis]|uniref:Acetyltransferase n=1 Tax=Actinoplanes awajinensis subsp. mycoplanecinus TaxID=135947 RepID=A0A101JDK4_9ACTN|nr:GNAT family N-acetyltransferase [Actinoplanes awajinensis]KUL24859.1 acetyltransferase [Actinoplanes awajinensis subsp. mycoplanecinus]